MPQKGKTYTKSLAQTVQTYICTCSYIVPVLGRGFYLMCKFWVCVCVCHPHVFVSMYITFHCLIISLSMCWEVKYVPCITSFTSVFITFFIYENTFRTNIEKLQNSIFFIPLLLQFIICLSHDFGQTSECSYY